jgi:hypothetical protein
LIIIAIWIAVLLALLTTATAIVKAALEVDNQEKAESLSFVRLALTGIFGVVIGQAVNPFDLAWL